MNRLMIIGIIGIIGIFMWHIVDINIITPDIRDYKVLKRIAYCS